MATKTQKQSIQRKARQMKAKTVKAVSNAGKQAKRVQVTLGDLIAAAFDTVGEARKVARVVSSTDMTLATGKHIVFVG